MVQDGAKTKIRIEHLTYAYDGPPVLKDITLDVPANAVTVLFGPAGGGKTTLLRLINRLNDLVEDSTMSGRVLLDGKDIYGPGVDVPGLRRRVGMVFALPLPLPGTIRENVLYGPMLAGSLAQKEGDRILYRSLTQAALWEEVKDRLDDPATSVRFRRRAEESCISGQRKSHVFAADRFQKGVMIVDHLVCASSQ